MKMKKHILCLMLTGVFLLATGCRSLTPLDQFVRSDAPEAIPEPVLSVKAPDGDLETGKEEEFFLYLPAREGNMLIPQSVILKRESTKKTAENLARQLLAYEANDEVISLCGDAAVTLYGENAVELSGCVCTVNLSSSVLKLEYAEIFVLAQAMACTLCELENIHCINLLAADMAIGLDITGNLPLGTVTARPDDELTVLWEEKMSQKTPLGGDLSRTSVLSDATLYFPTKDGSGIIAEPRVLIFPGQTPQQMAVTLLNALSEGPLLMNVVPDIPDLSSLQTHTPLVSELADGGRLITLTFQEDFREQLESRGLDYGNMIAAVTDTLSTFIPGIAALSIRIGGNQITGMPGKTGEHITFMGGLQKRGQFSGWLTSTMKLYFETDGFLSPCDRVMAGNSAENLREGLKALLAGPDREEMEKGFHGTLPEGLSDEDVLGIAVSEDEIILNLSDQFLASIESMGAEKEQLLCYSIVETLCEASGREKICFFFEGKQVDSIAGFLCWKGEFLHNSFLYREK